MQRQTAYVANERANLTTLAGAIKNGELYGGLIGGTVMASAGPSGGTYASANMGSPLVTIKFDRNMWSISRSSTPRSPRRCRAGPPPASTSSPWRPRVAPPAAVQIAQTAAKRHAQDVFRSMTDMGVPATRLAVSSSTDPGIGASEVRVFVR